MQWLIRTIEFLPSVVIGVVVHEFSHAWVAHLCGDDSAKAAGRVTFNPFRHFDLIGFLTLLVFRFGWANPVPVDSRRFRNYHLGMFLVSIAGICANFITALVCSYFWVYSLDSPSYWLRNFFEMTLILNLNLAVFNLFPIPPLDGSNILLSFFSPKTANEVNRYRQTATLVLVMLVVSGVLTKIMVPLVSAIANWMVRLW